MRRLRRVTWVLLAIAVVWILVVIGTLVLFPEWREPPENMCRLVAVALTGVIPVIGGIVSVLSDLGIVGKKDQIPQSSMVAGDGSAILTHTARGTVATGDGIAVSAPGNAVIGDYAQQPTVVTGVVNMAPGANLNIGPALVERVERTPFQLPADIDDFVGHDDDVTQIENLLIEGKPGAIICGMGGVGKTTLAVHVAHRVKDCYRDGQIVVDMRGIGEKILDPSDAMRKVIYALDPQSRLPQELDELVGLYQSVLADRNVLLILDNACDSDQVRGLIPAGKDCGVIVTSRRTFTLPGMVLFQLEELSEDRAVELLFKMVGDDRTTESELRHVAELCGTLPLALRAAGSFLETNRDWSVKDYLDVLADERRTLSRLKFDKEVDVGAVLGLSVVELAQKKPALVVQWEQLFVFVEPFRREAAAIIWKVEFDVARDRVSELVRWSLLLYDQDAELYRVHDLTALVAREMYPLKEDEWRRAVYQHAGLYLMLGQQDRELYDSGGEQVVEALRRYDKRWVELQAAYDRMSRYHTREALEWVNIFADDMGYFLNVRLRPEELIPVYRQAREGARQLGDRRYEVVHLGNLGNVLYRAGDKEESLACHREALGIAREISFGKGERTALSALATYSFDDADSALAYAHGAIESARDAGDHTVEAMSLYCKGEIYLQHGEFGAAIKCATSALKVAQKHGDRLTESFARYCLGQAYYDSGEVGLGVQHWRIALEIGTELGHRELQVAIHRSLAEAYGSSGDVWEALSHYQQAVELLRELDNERELAVVLVSLGLTYMLTRQIEHALSCLQDALDISQSLKDGDLETRIREMFNEAQGTARRWSGSSQI